MHKRGVALVALACVLVAGSPVAGRRDCVMLYDYLLGSPQYSIISQAIEYLPNLEPYTRCCTEEEPAQPGVMLLPNNDIIEQFLPVLGMNVTDLLEETELLESILRTHIILGDGKAFVDGQVISTANPSQQLEVTVSEEAICFSAWSYACTYGPSPVPVRTCSGGVIPVTSLLVPNAGAASTSIAG